MYLMLKLSVICIKKGNDPKWELSVNLVETFAVLNDTISATDFHGEK